MLIPISVGCKIGRAILRNGTKIRIYKQGRLTACTRAIINIERTKRADGRLQYGSATRAILGNRKKRDVVLFLPYSTIFEDDAPVTIECRGTLYDVIATADIPASDASAYTWALCRPASDSRDDFGDLDAGEE